MSCYTKGLPHSKYSLCISHYSDSNSSKVPSCCSPYISSLFSLSSSGTHLPFPWHIDVLSHPPAHSWLRGATCLPCLCSPLCMASPVLSAPPLSLHHSHSQRSPRLRQHFQVLTLCSVQHCPVLLCSEVLGWGQPRSLESPGDTDALNQQEGPQRSPRG